MPTKDVIDKVRGLDAELAKAPEVPAQARPEVDSTRKQLATILIEPGHAPHYAGLADRLRRLYAYLEADHPRLAGAVSGVLESLSDAGL